MGPQWSATGLGALNSAVLGVESTDKTWFTGEGNGKPLQYSCLENPMNNIKMQKDRTLKDELPRSLSAQYATGEEWKIAIERMNSQNKNNPHLWM